MATDESGVGEEGAEDDDPERVELTVEHGEGTSVLSVPPGTNLRKALLNAGISPYTALTERANCGGRGLCATCGVRLLTPRAPEHWHDRLAARFGYPRLSCQLTVTRDARVRTPEKAVWGGRSHDES
ncbi:2Fe-2S iron-sulfur cluster-binding protein [Halomarina salina]|uniref:2Fe-2S iron-sulfur cluster-binding protein n=1 Tax=Halomarina salina TaxID=1872699 RepID=A0ABD5RQ38_9EURY|nr:2Fe-2S iron-sulfur cluster-binding protein [Halomarina salina]